MKQGAEVNEIKIARQKGGLKKPAADSLKYSSRISSQSVSVSLKGVWISDMYLFTCLFD